LFWGSSMRKTIFNLMALIPICIVLISCGNHDDDIIIKTDYYGWAVGGNPVKGYGFVLHTSDGGNKWTSLSDPTQLKAGLEDVCIFDKNTLLVVGDKTVDGTPNVLKSIDGGKNWMVSGKGFLPNIFYNGIFKLNDQNVFIVGESGCIYKSTDMASSWTKIEVPILYQERIFLRIVAKNANDIWVVGDSYPQDSTPIMLHTIDGGVNWERHDPVKDLKILAASEGHYLGIKIFGNSIWVIGGFGKFIIRSADNGSTWTEITPSGGNADANDIFLLSETEAFVVTDYGGIVSTANGGTSWTKHEISTNNWLLGIDIIEGNKIWLCGSAAGSNDHSSIFYSGNKGITWEEQTPFLLRENLDLSLYKIRFIKVETHQ
jgi:photosystem II stability/assembly factor-like uncharacterized protein